MILENYKKLFSKSAGNNVDPTLKNIVDGGSITPAQEAQSYRAIIMFYNNPDAPHSFDGCFDVGFDDTPESETDYLFNGNFRQGILTLLSAAAPTKAYGEIIDLVTTYRNDTGSNVTVREIAALYNPAGVANVNKYCMLIRKVLENPVTIAPGEAYSFTYILKFKN